MALTMTRTRTQTTLTKLAQLVANLNGELAFVATLLADPSRQNVHGHLELRRSQLATDLHALHLTLKQFDPEIAPEGIGCTDEWAKAYGRRHLKKNLVTRYLTALTALHF